MGKQQKKHQRGDETSEDEDVVSDMGPGDDQSYDSEEEAMKDADQTKNSRKVGKVQDRESTKNKLKLGQFHRNATFKKKNRKVTTKKQIRDIERLLDRDGIPEEVRKAKKAQLVELKKEAKKQKEASLFETKYKKIKFTEKRKVIRRLEQVKKDFKASSASTEGRANFEKELKTLQD